jgi:hypothetical protein
MSSGTKPVAQRNVNAFAAKKGAGAATAQKRSAPVNGNNEANESKQGSSVAKVPVQIPFNASKKTKTTATAAVASSPSSPPTGNVAAATGGKFVKSKDKFSNKIINFLDLEKNEIYKTLKFVRPPGSKMIYFAFPNAEGGLDKQLRIRAAKRKTSSGLKVLPPKGTITTYNTIYTYQLTAAEYKFWIEKFLPWLCGQIWRNAEFFYGPTKGKNIAKKSEEQGIEAIMESMIGDSGEMFISGPKPNKDSSLPDYAPSLKLKVKEDLKTQLPIIDIFDSVTEKKGKVEDNFIIYSHPELLKFQAEHKENGPMFTAKHNEEVKKVQAKWKNRTDVTKEVGYSTVNDAIWNWFGLSPVNGSLWFSTALTALNRVELSSYKGSNVRQPGEKASNPFGAGFAAETEEVATGELPPPEEGEEEVKEGDAETEIVDGDENNDADQEQNEQAEENNPEDEQLADNSQFVDENEQQEDNDGQAVEATA